MSVELTNYGSMHEDLGADPEAEQRQSRDGWKRKSILVVGGLALILIVLAMTIGLGEKSSQLTHKMAIQNEPIMSDNAGSTVIGTESAVSKLGSTKFRFLDFQVSSPLPDIKFSWPGGNEVVVKFPSGYTPFGDGAGLNAFQKVTIVSSTVGILPAGQQAYFCKQCSSTSATKPGDSCWAITPITDKARACGCNSGGWTGQGVYYGGWLPGKCNRCGCWGGGFSGARLNRQQKGGVNVGLTISAMSNPGSVKYIQVNVKTRTFSGARKICTDRGYELASILSAAEQSQAAKVCTHGGWGCWFGLQRVQPGKNVWKWSDGATFAYSNWHGGEPNNAGGNEDCGTILGAKSWNDNPCNWSQDLPVLCQQRQAATGCPVGSYLSGGRCHSCPAGHYCTNSLKRQCPAGQYQGGSNHGACQLASCGHYVPAPGATAQLVCRAGTYQDAKGKTSCIAAPKGHYSGAGACSATKCPKGQYTDCAGQASCSKPPCGHIVDVTGGQLPKPCGPGTYQPAGGHATCVTTSPGTYAKTGYCRPRTCTPGSYQPSSGKSSCLAASCGHYAPGMGEKSQTVCPLGRYQPDKGQASCVKIPPGYIASGDKCSLVQCKPGEYYSNFKCVKTSCGHYTDTAGSMTQKKCPSGHYQDAVGQSACKPAPAGHTPNGNQCGIVKCPVGTYQSKAGQSTCSVTKCGEIAPSTGMTSPEKCAAGTFQAGVKQTACVPCAAGSAQKLVGQCSCNKCTAGTYQSKTGQTSCVPSPCGSHVPSAGAKHVTKCPAGTYQSKTGQSSCVNAPAGQYAVGGKCAPVKCPVGTYSSSSGMSSCTQSPCGKKVTATGQTKPTDCPDGYYQPLQGQSRCLAASRGSYAAGKGNCKVKYCSKGTYQDQPGRTTCKKAACGHYVASTAGEKQSPCGPGRWQDLTGQASCKKASTGHFAPGPASCTQSKCPTGTYSDCSGQSSCEKVPCGHFAAGTGNVNYQACAAGSYQDVIGQSSCKTTPKGHFSGSGFCYPMLCDVGSYQPLSGKATCDRAKCGHYVDVEGATAPKQCTAGSYQPNMGQTGCLSTSMAVAPRTGTCSICGTTNLAKGKPTGQIDNFGSGVSGKAVDGNKNQNWGGNSCTHTTARSKPWWYVDLQRDTSVCEVKIWNRQDCCPDRLSNFKVFVKKTKPVGAFTISPSEVCYYHDASKGVFSVKSIKCNTPVVGRYVGVQLMGTNGVLTLCEFEAFGVPLVSNEWILIARQRVSNGYFPKSVVTTGKLGTASGSGNYLNLPALAQYNVNEEYTMKLVWPGSTLTKDQIWIQKSNPWLKKSSGVVGYKPVSVGYTGMFWGGEEWNGGTTLLDGSPVPGHWWYAVGSFSAHVGGIPGPDAKEVNHVEFYVKKPSGPYCSLSVRFDMPGNDMWHGRVANVNACQQKCLNTAGCACYAADYPQGTACWLKRSCPLSMNAQGARQTGYCFKA